MVCNINQSTIRKCHHQVLLTIVTRVSQPHMKATQQNHLYPLWRHFQFLLHAMHGWLVVQKHVCPYNVPLYWTKYQKETHHVRTKVDRAFNLSSC